MCVCVCVCGGVKLIEISIFLNIKKDTLTKNTKPKQNTMNHLQCLQQKAADCLHKPRKHNKNIKGKSGAVCKQQTNLHHQQQIRKKLLKKKKKKKKKEKQLNDYIHKSRQHFHDAGIKSTFRY